MWFVTICALKLTVFENFFSHTAHSKKTNHMLQNESYIVRTLFDYQLQDIQGRKTVRISL